MTSTSVPWNIAYVSGVIFNVFSGFLTCFGGSVGWISEYVSVSQCGLSTTGQYNGNNSNSICASVFVPKWIWWIVVLSLLRVGFAGETSPSKSGKIQPKFMSTYQLSLARI